MEIPQQLSPQATEELKDIYEDEFGLSLSDGEAQEIGMRILRLFNITITNPEPNHRGIGS